MPEPQTRLIVVALVVDGEARVEGRLAGGRLAGAGLDDLAHQDVVDARVLGQARAFDGRPDRDATELHGRRVDERPAELADRRTRRADDVDVPVGGIGNHDPESTAGPIGAW